MKSSFFIAMCIIALLAAACENNADKTTGFDFETINVNFEGSLSVESWIDGDEIGIFATCTRDEEQNVQMSVNVNAKYTAEAGGKVNLLKASDNDQIIANKGDHNFRFYAYYPYSAASTDRTAIGAQVPATQYHADGVMKYGMYIAEKSVTNVVPTVNLEFNGVFSILELYLPDDIADWDGNSVIRSLTLKPAVPENFTGTLADGGMVNLETGVFTSNPEMQEDTIYLDFGDAGLTLTDAFTKVSLAVAPFTVPEGGFIVTIRDTDGETNTVTFLKGEDNAGVELEAGYAMAVYLSSDDDGIIPVTFPVVFPLGIWEESGAFTPARQPLWVSQGIWSCLTQTQAYAQWYKVSDPVTSPIQFLETINSGVISSPGIKGIWTGDYLEFVLPVKKFAAGTSVTVKFPMYTRFGPVFWYIEYLDGDEWKCNKSLITCYDPAYSLEATYSLIRGGTIIEHTMLFTEEIRSGYVKIRFKCADGSILAATDTNVAVYETPHINSAGTAYDAPTYFYLSGSDVTSITFSIN